MKALELAQYYLKAFIGEVPVEEMHSILSGNLSFEGPFLSVHSAEEYIESLKKDPIQNATIKIIDEFGKENSACLIYELIKPEVSILVAQWFKTDNGKIVDIRIVFDSGKFI